MPNLALTLLSKRHPKIVTQQEKMYYVLALLASIITKVDGKVSDKETAALLKIVEKLGVSATDSQLDAFLKGIEDCDCKAVSITDVLDMVEVFERHQDKLNLLKILIKLSSADGTLDKAEYTIIFKVANTCNIPIPEFESLAEKLNIATGNAARDRQFEIASGVLKTIGKGVVATAILGFQIIELFLQDSNTQPRKKQASSSNKSTRSPEKKDIKQRVYRGGSKNCALCVHWHGQRKVEPSRKQVLVDLQGQPNGVCVVSPGGKRKVLASHTCANFSPII